MRLVILDSNFLNDNDDASKTTNLVKQYITLGNTNSSSASRDGSLKDIEAIIDDIGDGSSFLLLVDDHDKVMAGAHLDRRRNNDSTSSLADRPLPSDRSLLVGYIGEVVAS